MRLTYRYEGKGESIKSFVKTKGISRKLLARIKFQGGCIEVNGQEENVLYTLKNGDELVLTLPKEESHDAILVDDTPLDILYEDEAILVVNKPIDVPSVPVSGYLNGTMVNRVKAYYQKQQYEDQVVHTVTRLDKDTSGVMLFAKSSYVHALCDQLLRQKQIQKTYLAYVTPSQYLEKHGHIRYHITRPSEQTIKRQATLSGGQSAWTEYWVMHEHQDFSEVEVRLHTGRTHQIRVHFQALEAPLLGDTLYGDKSPYIQRQALHCRRLAFVHPLTNEKCVFEAPIPYDMQQIKERVK